VRPRANPRDVTGKSRCFCSDETSASVSGMTWFEWVIVAPGVLHVIRPSRPKAFVGAVRAVRPMVWGPTCGAAQRGHGLSSCLSGRICCR